MQAVEVFNITSNPVQILGLGTVDAESRKNGFIETATFDADFNAYKDNAARSGVVVRDALDSYTPTGYQEVTGAVAVAAPTRACVCTNGTGAGYALTLPAANSLAAGTILYFFYDSGAHDVNVTRAGADTINGGAAPVAINAGSPILRLQTNGATAWTSV